MEIYSHAGEIDGRRKNNMCISSDLKDLTLGQGQPKVMAHVSVTKIFVQHLTEIYTHAAGFKAEGETIIASHVTLK